MVTPKQTSFAVLLSPWKVIMKVYLPGVLICEGVIHRKCKCNLSYNSKTLIKLYLTDKSANVRSPRRYRPNINRQFPHSEGPTKVMALHGCQLKMVAILCCCKLILAQFHQPILDSSLEVPDVFAFFNSQFCCPILANEVSTLQLGVQTLMRLSCVEFKMGLCLFYTVFLSNQPCGSRPMKKQYPLSGFT